ncbi:hypothetical protein H7S55_14720 [Priestia aryabhattai]|uniref:hypothetical protein n=1 Tax=Priestia aryabhattai TaxID=412384 RepID=UPI001C8DAE83|nr:hypothetical protein [Priestia aryabhattai]MBY0001429.1 hypothetical protein [Priestia aryabhattai]
MITLFIDESGQFENERDSNYVVVGGILVKHQNKEELDSLCKEVEAEFIRIHGNDYHNNIHGTTRNLNNQQKIITNIINNRERFKDIIPIFIEKGNITRIINSNITDDNTTGMLYFNMLNDLITNIILYYPGMTKDEKNINIYLASRVTPENELSSEAQKHLDSLGIDKGKGKYGDNLYYLNNQTSSLINLHNELSRYPFLEEPLTVNIKKEIINYSNRNKEYMNLFYIADIVCNDIYNMGKRGLTYNLTSFINFLYDDINSEYKKIFRNYAKGELFDFLANHYDYNIKFNQQNNYKKVYDSYLSILEGNLDEIINKDSLRNALYSIRQLSAKGKYNRQKLIYLLTFLEKYIDEFQDLNKVIFYDLLLRAYNHVGSYNKAEVAFNKLINIASGSTSIEMINLKREVLTRYASTMANIFDFQKALYLIDNIIDVQQILEETLNTIDSILFNETPGVNKGMMLGKLYSAKAQYFSFLKKPEAYDFFIKALEFLEDHPGNKRQTMSYLVHFLCDHLEIEITSQMKDQLNKYFEGDNFSSQLNFLLDEERYMKPPRTFQMFAFVKLYSYRLTNEIDYNQLDKLVNRITKIPNDQLQHPWELIFYNIARLYSDRDRELAEKLTKCALDICLINSKNITMYILGLMIQIRMFPSEESVEKFIVFIENTKINNLYEYFSIGYLKDMNNINDKISYILSKFKFTYH